MKFMAVHLLDHSLIFEMIHLGENTELQCRL